MLLALYILILKTKQKCCFLENPFYKKRWVKDEDKKEEDSGIHNLYARHTIFLRLARQKAQLWKIFSALHIKHTYMHIKNSNIIQVQTRFALQFYFYLYFLKYTLILLI